ncbi:hypothetical protein F4805DRAFT_478746 [Annulohypoxylon moriforme]|nr:hypothetical protein F4805DRAFT_478746 [Annulohypoxylon moriforme]
MLPTFLEQPYAQCKLDTSSFITWLVDTARSCRHETGMTATMTPPPPPSSLTTRNPTEQVPARPTRTTGRQRSAGKYELSLREMDKLVNTIIQLRPTVRLPKGIKAKLQRAIDVRQRCLDWFRNTEHSPGEFDIEGHRYFIRFLKDTQSRFLELESLNASIPKPAAKTLSTSTVCFGNRFAELATDNENEL